MKDYVVFIGDVALDEYYSAERWPSIKDKISVETLPPQYGGMIANAACVYASMGEDVRFMGMLNRGPVSKMLIENLNQSGIDTDLMVFDDTLPDSKCIIILAEDEHTVFIPNMHVERIEITENQLEALKGATYVYSTLTTLGRLCCGELSGEEIVRRLRAAGVFIVCDLDVGYLEEEDERYYQNLDIAIFNEVGFKKYQDKRTDEQAVADLLSYGTKVVIVTKAEKGCDVYSQDGHFTSPAADVPVVDVTGAGDTFCASFLFAYKKSGDLRYAAKFANTAAGICIQTVGARAGAVGEETVLRQMKKDDSK